MILSIITITHLFSNGLLLSTTSTFYATALPSLVTHSAHIYYPLILLSFLYTAIGLILIGRAVEAYWQNAKREELYDGSVEEIEKNSVVK